MSHEAEHGQTSNPQSGQTEGLKFDHAQLRATPPNAPVSAGYLQITNTTGQTQTLVSASAPFAKRAEIHDMKNDSGVMKMYEIERGLAVPDRLTVALMHQRDRKSIWNSKPPLNFIHFHNA